MNPIAEELNQSLKNVNPELFDALSQYGKRIFYPKGILKQSAEAKAKAHLYDATIGIATKQKKSVFLPCFNQYFNNLNPDDVFPYAPPFGKMELRNIWLQKIRKENPVLKDVPLSLPIVSSAITHGMSVIADLFADIDDEIVIPDKYWPNYRLIFKENKDCAIRTYPLFNSEKKLNISGMRLALDGTFPHHKKVITILNFPNNPTGYCPTPQEMEQISNELVDFVTQSNITLIAVCDDAYYGLSYDYPNQPSIFSYLANRHERLLAIKLDALTKEAYAWGFRVGFITYSIRSQQPDVIFKTLTEKTAGTIRASISSSSNLSQEIAIKGLSDAQFSAQHKELWDYMKGKAVKTREVLQQNKYESAWEPYPFNAGYFMTLRLKTVNAEQLRLHLLDHFGIGTISMGDEDLRIAFSCLEEDEIPKMFDMIYQGIKELESK